MTLVSGKVIASDIAICGDRIVGTHGVYKGKREIDIAGRIVVPGFIDTHLHIESSLVTPHEFDRCVLRHGVTTAICDPHEIANVLGVEGLRYFFECAEHTIMDIRVQLSSCVPATHLETSGARLTADDLKPFMGHPKNIGLAEFMNFPGVLNLDPECLDKLALFQDGHIDGHAPLVRGMDLNGYLSAGIRTDHETTTAEEALEKLSKGMHILIREGSVSKDLHALVSIMTERNSPFIALCTDDRNPLDIAEEGHLDFMIREAIANGADVLATYRAASISAAKAFRMYDRGLVAPGWRADLVVVDRLEIAMFPWFSVRVALLTMNCLKRASLLRPLVLRASNRKRFQRYNYRRGEQGRMFRSSASTPAKLSPNICAATCQLKTAWSPLILNRTASRFP